MKLSIIVPIYNVEEYLQECLESLYKISGIKKEIILVNDGSPDNSWKIMEDFKERFPEETVIVNKENGGLSSARNAGIRTAKGEYIAFIDSDDFIDPKAFQEFFKLGTAENPDVVIGNMRYYMDGRAGNPLFRSQKVKESGLMTGIEFFALLFEKKQKCFREEVVDDLYRRNFLIENNLFFTEGILHEDSEFTPKVYLRAAKAKYVDIPFYYYRQRSGSIMNVLSEKSMNSLEKICYTLAEEYDSLDSEIGEEALSKLIISFYKVVVYKHYNAGGEFKSFHQKYRQLFLRLKGFKNKNFEESLLFFSVALPNFMRKIMGIEITNRQKMPKL